MNVLAVIPVMLMYYTANSNYSQVFNAVLLLSVIFVWD